MPPIGDHNCIHDKLVRAAPVVQTTQHYEVDLPRRRLRAPLNTDHHHHHTEASDRPAESVLLDAPPPPLQRHLQAEGGAADAVLAAVPKRRPIRIHLDTSKLDSDPRHSCFNSGDYHYTEYNERKICYFQDVITDAKRSQLRDVILPGAAKFMEQMLSVHRVVGPLRIGAATCGYGNGVRVPDAMRSHGVDDADFVVFVTMRPIKSPETVAYSGHCETDQTGRPIAAHFNWAPSQLPLAYDQFMTDYLIRIAMHELTHSLVFSQELIANFPSDATPPADPSGGGGLGYAYDSGYYGTGISSFETGRGVKAHISTPRVTQAVRNHFGCERLRGAQLEDGGGAGTSNSHWEMRNFRDEYMVGSSSPSKRYFSTVTAALYADSGWYGVNEEHVEHLAWGHGLGCDFVYGSCAKWKDLHEGYFCETSGETTCSYDRKSEAYCEVMTWPKDLPVADRHFADSHRGGFSELLDYCPTYRTYSNGECTSSLGGLSWMPSGGQDRCESCRCFVSTVDGLFDHPGCFNMRCLNSSSLQVNAGGAWRWCPPEGGRIFLDSTKDATAGGSVICPPAGEICMVLSDLWPTLTSIEPSSGPAAGGVTITLRGENLDAFHAPFELMIGTAEGIDTAAHDLRIVNASYATATMPMLRGATSFATADVTLVDHFGRAAYLFEGFRYTPGWQPYAATLGVFVGICVLALYVGPRLVRDFCQKTKVIRETLVWRKLDPRVLDTLFSRTPAATPAGDAPAGAPAASAQGADGNGAADVASSSGSRSGAKEMV